MLIGPTDFWLNICRCSAVGSRRNLVWREVPETETSTPSQLAVFRLSCPVLPRVGIPEAAFAWVLHHHTLVKCLRQNKQVVASESFDLAQYAI